MKDFFKKHIVAEWKIHHHHKAAEKALARMSSAKSKRQRKRAKKDFHRHTDEFQKWFGYRVGLTT